MVKLDAKVGDVVLHCEVEVSLGMVPFKVNAREQVSLPVLSYSIVLFKGSPEVKGMTLADILNAKVVNY